AGIYVNEDTALRLTAVFAAVKILAESLAVLPLILYRRLRTGGKERATDHPLYTLAHDTPNEDHTSFELRELLQGHLGLRGNGYAEIIRDGRGIVRELEPLDPRCVRPYRLESGRPAYEVSASGKTRILLGRAGEILHVRAYSIDGLIGLSPIAQAREAVGLGLAAEEYGSRFFVNDATPGGVLEHPMSLGDTARKHIKEDWQKIFAGAGRHSIAVLEEGMKYTQVGISNHDAQFLELRKFQISEIARIYRVPPHMLADLDRATFANIEHMSLEFVMFSLLPWLRRWEQAFNRDLLTPSERQTYYFEFLVEGFLRGDFESRQRGLSIQRQNGIINANEWREIENKNPIGGEDGAKYWEPKNMGTGGMADPLAPQEKKP
ncbi:MAG: phage portal protein, partial [Pseudonocardiaceae bacterium]